MTGRIKGVAAQMKKDNPNMVSVHCIAHREALAAADAAKRFPDMNCVDGLVNKVSEWMGRSKKRHSKFQHLLEALNMKMLEI